MDIDLIGARLGNDSNIPGVPKYLRLSETITALIEDGSLAAGEKLASETAMAKRLPFSLGTIQKALAHMANQGVLERRHGSGTFVSKSGAQLQNPWHFRFLDDDGKTLLPIYTQVTSIESTDENGPWTQFFEDDGHYICIHRTIDVNREFKAKARYYLPGKKHGNLVNAALKGLDGIHLRDFLRKEYGVTHTHVVEHLACETFPDDICSSMGLAPKSNGLLCHFYGYGPRNSPTSFQELFVPPNTRRLEVRELSLNSL